MQGKRVQKADRSRRLFCLDELLARLVDRLKLAGLASLALTLLGGLAMILGKLLVDMHSH